LRFYSLSLEHHHWVRFQIAQIQFLTFAGHFLLFFDQQPTDVTVEEASTCVVGVRIRVRVLVVDPMVSTPVVDVFLEGDGLVECQQDSQW
jgi:hypothetical protein